MAQPAKAANEVMVVFRDAAVIFALPDKATLEDLATRIGDIEERHFGAAVSIDVQLRH